MNKDKLRLLSVMVCCCVSACLWGQHKAPQYEPYMEKGMQPDGVEFLPEPPSMTVDEFYNDFYYYQWGVKQREDSLVSWRALEDEKGDLPAVFSEAFGLPLSAGETPEIVTLASRASYDAYYANKHVKDHYQRLRPFAVFNQPSLKPNSDEKTKLTWSYPSGHSSCGYMFALALCTVNPDRTEQIMKRAREYALNRVICGHHWKSDTEASLMLVAGVFANIVVCEEYQKQLAKARKEFRRRTAEREKSLGR